MRISEVRDTNIKQKKYKRWMLIAIALLLFAP